MSAPLGRIQRVHSPYRDALVLGVYTGEGQAWLVVSTSRPMAWCTERIRGADADSVTLRLRKLITGCTAIHETLGDQERLRLVGGGRDFSLECERGMWILRQTADGHPLAARQRVARKEPKAGWSTDARPLPVHDAPWWSAGYGDGTALRRSLRSHRKRLEARLRNILADAARGQRVATLRSDADLLMANTHRFEAGTSFPVEDWDGQLRTFSLGVGEGPVETASRLYRKARKLERGARIAAERAEMTRNEIRAAETLLARLEEGKDSQQEIRSVARRLGVRGLRSERASGRKPPPRRPYRTFHSPAGAVLVGRNAMDNDTLTFHIARPHDLWLHVRGRRGSHVIVPLAKGHACTASRLVDAATLAAHFSEAAKEETVEIQHVQRKHVRKPRKAASGSVVVTREKVILIRRDAERLRRLLSSETESGG